MQKKLTITLNELVYNGLYSVIGDRKISKFIENLVAPYVLINRLDKAYAEMAQDSTSETEALDWVENLCEDHSHETR